MRTRYSKKKQCWVATDPDYPGVRGLGQTEDAAIEDLEDRLDDWEASEFEADLRWRTSEEP